MKEFSEIVGILENENVRTLFQPIVNLTNGQVIGYEALSRGPKGSILEGPLDMLRVAEKHNLLWEIELLFRRKSIERSIKIDKDKLLFINVDPNIIKDKKFEKGFTKDFLAEYGISPKTVIFEITERTAIADYMNFRAVLDNYKEQGYKIAIDDVGSGYSGMKTITETQPNYIKIDMDLIRNIDSDSLKRAIMQSFVKLGESTGIRLIAEGIETKQELKTLIQMGVYAGQGYLLQRPAGTFLDIPDTIRNLIRKYYMHRENHSLTSSTKTDVGHLSHKSLSFPSDTPVSEICDYFKSSESEGVCITHGEKPIGLLMRHSLNEKLATQYGVALYSNRPVHLIMDARPLIVDYHDSVTMVSEIAMERTNGKLYNLIIVTRGLSYHGLISIRDLLNYTTVIEKNYARELNPLTFLPGNAIINRVLKNGIDFKRKCAILYLDLDNFKAYNDNYGFENGDKILKMTADLIKNKLIEHFSDEQFLGHIGGDDFVCVVDGPAGKIKAFCSSLTKAFDLEAINYFNEKDTMQGFFENACSQNNRLPLTALSIAGFYGDLSRFSSAEDLGHHMGLLKKEVKNIAGSCSKLDF